MVCPGQVYKFKSNSECCSLGIPLPVLPDKSARAHGPRLEWCTEEVRSRKSHDSKWLRVQIGHPVTSSDYLDGEG